MLRYGSNYEMTAVPVLLYNEMPTTYIHTNA